MCDNVCVTCFLYHCVTVFMFLYNHNYYDYPVIPLSTWKYRCIDVRHADLITLLPFTYLYFHFFTDFLLAQK